MYVQATNANKVNELTGVANSVGQAWATPTNDASGNRIGIPNIGSTNTGATIAWTPPLTKAK